LVGRQDVVPGCYGCAPSTALSHAAIPRGHIAFMTATANHASSHRECSKAVMRASYLLMSIGVHSKYGAISCRIERST